MVGVSIVASVLVFQSGVIDGFARPKYFVIAASALVLFGAGVAEWWRGRLRSPARGVDLAVTGYVAWNVLAFVASDIGVASFHGERYQYQGLAAVLAYSVAYGAVRIVSDRRVIPVAVVVAGGIAAAYGIAQFVGADPFWDVLFKDRIFSTFGQPNNLGSYLAMSLPFALMLGGHSRAGVRCAARSASIVIAVAICLSMSRGAYVAVAIAALGSGLLMWRRWRAQPRSHLASRRGLARIGAVAVVVVVVLAAAPLTRPAVESVADRGASILAPLDSSNSKRLDLWVVAGAIIEDHPLLGIGHEAYPEAFPGYAETELSAESREALAPFRPESPHNVYLATAVNAGVVAAVLYAAVLGWAIWTAGARVVRTGAPVAVAVFFALVAHAVTDAFMTAEAAGTWLAWLLIGWLAATQPHTSSETRKST